MRIKYHHRQYTAVRTFVSGCEGPSIAVLVRSVLVVWRVKPNNLILLSEQDGWVGRTYRLVTEPH